MRCIRPLILGAAVALYAGASATADRPLGSAKQLSPGAVIGTSYWDRQCNFATTRRVHLSTAAGRELVHHVWTFQPAPPVWERTAHYRLYDIAGGAYSPGVDIPEGTRIRAGFGDMWITDDNRAVIAYQHYSDPDQRYHLWTAFDSAAGAGEFSNLVEIPDSIDFYSLVNYQSPLWPHVAYVEGVHDTVLHIVAQESLQYPDSVAIFYFRRVGSDSDPTAVWDYPPRVIDSNYNWGSHQLAATSDGRVAIAWTANVPCAGDPDTASGVGCSDFVFWENDLYFQVSNDQGLTWQNRVNVTRYSETPEHPYRAHWEISALFDHLGVLHMIWSAAAWPRTAPGPGEVAQTASAIFHWSETNPTPTMVRETNWNQTVCGGGEGRPLNIGDISLAECDGRLYTLFVQFNDYDAGIMSDCCDSNLTFYPDGAANGDLYICVSSDGGLTWDAARNLTSTRTPGCRFDTPGNVCACESWPSVTPYGSNVSIDPSISGADVVVPAGGSDPGWYLDVQYVLDPLPSSPMTQEGWRTETSIRWFRIACVDPIQEPDLAILPDSLAYPVYTPHCAERLVPIVLSNSGVGEGHYSIIAEEFAGPAGWLGTTGFSGTVAAGAAADTGY
ncbi:MAG TPA: hypothetical protein PKW75_09075, partial [candidate division Zixibacteria bacterium]|nr:hypothetical protein [candidate division Zixibacteria bacterium]